MFLLIGQVISTVNFYVGIIIPPVAIVLGGLGNVFSLLVFILSPLRKLRSSPFLIGLCLAHLVTLTCVLAIWLQKFKVYLLARPGWCQLLNYFFHMSNFLGVAFVLSFTVERYLSFCWYRNATMRIGGSSMYRKCVGITIALVVIVALTYSYMFVLLGSTGNGCTFIPMAGYRPRTKDVPLYLISLSHIIIGLMLIVTLGLDICIMFTILHRQHNHRETNSRSLHDSRSLNRDFESVDNMSIGRADDLTSGMDTCQRNRLSTLPRPLRIIRSRELRRSRSLLSIRSTINATRMLFATSVTFTLMQSFFAGLQFLNALLVFTHRANTVQNTAFYNSAVTLYIMSLSVGFIVYMLCGNNFREAIKMLVTCQYGRGCAHVACVKRRAQPRPPRIVTSDEPETENGRSTSDTSAGTIDSVSRYIDDTSRVSVR